MSHAKRQAIYALIGLLLLASGFWWWTASMEPYWTARIQVSEAARQNPMLGATRLLERHRHTVTIADTLAQAQRAPLPDGTLFLLDNVGIITQQQAARLLAWVERGNTLVVRPKWNGRTTQAQCGEHETDQATAGERDSANKAQDPIAEQFGVELGINRRPHKNADDDTPCFTHVTIPGSSHALQLNVDWFTLRATGAKPPPRFGDDNLDVLRVHARGAGHVAFVAENRFDNSRLDWYDNAELLLALAELNHGARHVLIVRNLEMPSWYQALWWRFKFGIIGTGFTLLLLLWLGVRRFGPLLPDPDEERRSLIEHIDASGRWLWKVPGGRTILLAAVRNATGHVLLRRAPELLRLTPTERVIQLARTCRLPHADVADALLGPAAKLPIEFTRQIQTLQLLRQHHER